MTLPTKQQYAVFMRCVSKRNANLARNVKYTRCPKLHEVYVEYFHQVCLRVHSNEIYTTILG